MNDALQTSSTFREFVRGTLTAPEPSGDRVLPPILSNLAALPSYVVDGGSVSGNPAFGMSLMGTLFLRRPVGTLPNPVADVNVDATERGWRVDRHSDHVEQPYPLVWPWYDRVFRELGAIARGAQR